MQLHTNVSCMEIYAEEPLRIKRSTGHTKEEPDLNFNTDDSEDMYIEDRLGMDWASIHMKEESRRKFSTDDAMRKGEYSADSVDEDGSTSPKRQPDSAKIPMTDRYSHLLNHPYSQKYIDRRQLFVGNLTWWTTDQDIADAILGIGVTDFKEVKFFENRLNGQSKGFCVVTMGSEESLRICMEKLPDKELHGQRLLVSFPTRSAISVFEAQTKKGLEPRQNPGPKRLIGNKARPPLGMRSVRLPPGLLPPGSAQQMPGALMGPAGHQPLWHPHVPPPPPPQGHAHSGFQYNNWNTPRANAPAAPPPPPLYSAPPPPPGPPPGPPPAHTAPVFFQQGTGPPHHPPPPTHQPPPNFYAPPPAPQTQFSVPPPKLHPDGPPPVSEVEFQEVMGRNRSISSSAIARAVSDAAAGEYTRAIETLVTAISLIKQSKVANDARCKILVSSLQDTLNGIETKSFESARRERSQSRERERSLRSRRERSRSHDRAYRERSRERERERDHDRSYADVYLHDRSRSRERERERDYRDRAHEDRYYDERYREREQERDHEGIRHEAERERERDRDRERRDDGRESSHRSIRH